MNNTIESASSNPRPAAAPAGESPALGDPRRHREIRAEHSGGAIHRFLAFLGWIFGGFGLVAFFHRRHGPHYKVQEVVVYSVHRAFFLWALILTGFIGAGIVHHWPGAAQAMGWAWMAVLIYTFLTLTFDVNLPKFLLLAAGFAFVWLMGKYVQDLKNVPILHAAAAFLVRHHPSLDPGMALLTSLFLVVPWIGALGASFFNGRKKITPNEIGEWFLGNGSELTDRSGLKFKTVYRDLLETCLGFGCGDLVALDNNHNVVKRWENILFLFFIWGRLDEILHQRSAVVDNAPDDPVEVEEAR
ncbi:MAG TPA: hypothetical protein VFC78_00220 [Tepidisphaeraceae bacterium]|nr:hypothetical protein [Tepidisphaeraceae bacterium]